MAPNSPELITHCNYVTYLLGESTDLRINYQKTLRYSSRVSTTNFRARINLIRLTHESIHEELQKVNSNPEYARVCSAWIAIKSYYMLFCLETILFSIITTQNKLGATHSEVRRFIRTSALNGDLTSSPPTFLSTIRHSTCQRTGLRSGANLSSQLSDSDRYKQVMKKLREYALEEYKRVNGYRRMTAARTLAFNNKTISLCDFFYWYRIKSNYRDLEFIAGNSAATSDLYNFYKNYAESALNTARAYIDLINTLNAQRTNQTQLISF